MKNAKVPNKDKVTAAQKWEPPSQGRIESIPTVDEAAIAVVVQDDNDPPTDIFGNQDVNKMLVAILPLLKNEDEKQSIEVRSINDGKMLEVFLKHQSTVVRPNALRKTRNMNDWNLTAQGCLDRLRNNHSLTPQPTYNLEDVYREKNLMLLQVFREGLSPESYVKVVNAMNSLEISKLKNEAARLKAINTKFTNKLKQAVKIADKKERKVV